MTSLDAVDVNIVESSLRGLSAVAVTRVVAIHQRELLELLARLAVNERERRSMERAVAMRELALAILRDSKGEP